MPPRFSPTILARGNCSDTSRSRGKISTAQGMSAAEAYMLCSVCADLRISEIVDVPNFVVTAYCPLGIFG